MEAPGNGKSSIGALAALFVKLGTIGFGGPAAHIAMMEEEVVERRKWLSHERFLDLVGATSLIPGPNSTEMAIHIGYIQAGWRGLLVAGAGFVIPAVLTTTALAWAYVEYGSLPSVAPFLYGIKPAVLAVILGALWRLGSKAVKSWRLGFLALAVTLVAMTEFNVVLALIAGGIVGMFWLRAADMGKGGGHTAALAVAATSSSVGAATTTVAAAEGVAVTVGPALWPLVLFFLKIGAILYGSGYVLVAFLEEGLVHNLGWITQTQLLEAIAIGQFTPGPVLSTAAFVGYLVLGFPGAIAASAAIFFPSFLFVAALNPVIPHLRKSPWMAAFLDSVNVCSMALMAAVTMKLSYGSIGSWETAAIAIVAAVLNLRWQVNAFWLVLGGAVSGWVFLQLK